MTNGIRLFCLESGPADGPLVLLLHGFPEIAYSWRHQIGPLGEAGFHVVAPDLPGYGRSDKPDVTYDCEWINATLIGLVDALGAERVVIAGHDWGGLLVWIMARQYPERIAGVIGVNTPDLPRPPVPPVQILRGVIARPAVLPRAVPGPRCRRVGVLVGRSRARRLRRRDVPRARDRGRRRVPARGARGLQACVSRPTGALTPPLEYYRNMDRNWELTAAIADRTIDVPCLMISADDDRVLTPAMADGMEARVPDLEKIVIEHCGHWTQQEHPQETTAAMLAYLRRLDRW